ncbi:MAG: DUF1818 family protein [Phormidesmis sp.]
MSCHICSGEGWRLGWNPAADFCGMASGEHWSIELTTAELTDFCRGVRQLEKTMTAMAEQLMAEERLTCEQETAAIWLEAEGFPSRYSLRFILLSGRRGEGEWPPASVPGLVAAINQPPFSQLH